MVLAKRGILLRIDDASIEPDIEAILAGGFFRLAVPDGRPLV